METPCGFFNGPVDPHETLWGMIEKMTDKAVLVQAKDMGFYEEEDEYGRQVVPDYNSLRQQIFEAMAEL